MSPSTQLEQMLMLISRSRNYVIYQKPTLILSGFFQSYKYFSGAKNDIRNEFTFPSRVQDEVHEYYKNITPFEWKGEQFVRVGIHVRRTSLISENRQKMGFIPRPPSYFVHAMDYFMKLHNRVQFIVASDDLSWCKKNIIGDYVVYSTHNYIIDLAILSLSDHVIISLGTYSWWAGWLCQGTTVYYGKMPPNDTYLGKVYNNNSYVPVPDDTYNNWVAVV
ncbi:hypothetical protein LSH36_743g01020 [Paralvinella palmiformis]|uniref:L-Fucosyltransferase n=1 Tax=Paralvinella palmiformis TaxID=53620 RepID=A0AAD9J235_9ANNE|nr:hypothetical protein LSH36_743g01020 [Paralvinella palmiformis]